MLPDCRHVGQQLTIGNSRPPIAGAAARTQEAESCHTISRPNGYYTTHFNLESRHPSFTLLLTHSVHTAVSVR